MPNSPLAVLKDVVKNFGDVAALRGVSFEIAEGDVVALLGANGAGKTTAIEILLGQRQADRGEVRLLGEAPQQISARKRIGVTPQDSAFPINLRVREVIDFVRAHYDEPVDCAAIIEQFGLSDIADRRTGGLSGGQRRRLGVALAFVSRPTLMFLDEPTVGLDVTSRREVWNHVRAYVRSGGSLLFTTHYIEEAEALASRVLVIDQGLIRFSGDVENIKSRLGARRLSFAAATLPSLPGVVERRERDGRFELTVRDSDAAVRALVNSGVAFKELSVAGVALEDAVVALLQETPEEPSS